MAGMGNQLTRLIPAQIEASITAASDRQGCRAETPSRMIQIMT